MSDNQNESPEKNICVEMTPKQYEEWLRLCQEKKELQHDAGDGAAPVQNSGDSHPVGVDDAQLPPMIDNVESSIGWDFGLQGKGGNQDISIDEDMVDGNDTEGASGFPGKSESKNFLFDPLREALQSQELRQNLCSLQGKRAQLIIDYLYTVLLEPKLPETWLRRHCLVALYKLSKSSLLYPHCYSIKESIAFGNSRVASGGYSDIYKGKLGEMELCLKVVRLPSEGDASYMLKIYAKEAILWGQLRHPNIVPFYGLFYRDEIRRELCLVSPWMRHGDLGEYLRTHSSPNRANLSCDVVRGVGYLHQLGLIHSDLKAANVLVNDLGRALITDFGMSFIRTDKTLADVVVSRELHGGSTRWLAPELLEEEAHATMASDIWALGCVLNQIMTGKSPFANLSMEAQVMRALISGKKPGKPVSTSDPVEKTIWEEVVRCFDPTPEKRPNCQEIIDKFQSAGMLWGDERVALADALRKRQDFLQAMHMDSKTSLNIEEVGRVFENLKTDIEQVLGSLLIKVLLDIVRSKEPRENLEKLQGSKAQVVLDYLQSVLLGPVLTKSKLRNHCSNSFVRLSHTSNLEPPFYSLKKSIVLGAATADGNTDIHKVTIEGKTLQLIVIRCRLPPASKKLLKWHELQHRPINHPNIVPLYGLYSIGDQEHLCLASQWMSHGTISQYRKSFPDAPLAPFIYDVASGLGYLQSHYPSTAYLMGVLCSLFYSGPPRLLKTKATILVNDLHRACIFPVWVIHFEELFEGTPGTAWCYMAPEHVLSDSRFSKASDIWAFGCTCYNVGRLIPRVSITLARCRSLMRGYQILTGNRPFHSITGTSGQVYRRLIDEHKAGHKPGEVMRTFSNPIEEVTWTEIDRCWSPNPSDRPTIQEILSNLESVGLSRENEGFNEDDAEREKQHMRELLGDAEPVDLKAVQGTFEELKQAKE